MELRKKFSHGDYYQVSYSQLEEKFNCTQKQAKSAIKLLFETGVIIQHLINDEHGANQMYLEVVPEILHIFNTEEKEKRNHRKDRNKIEIINVAQSDFNKITKAHKVIMNYKKSICSIMGFLRNAIINNWSLDDKESHSDNSFNEYLKRNGLKSEEELTSILFAS